MPCGTEIAYAAVVCGTVCGTEIGQGGVGDCWFLSALSVPAYAAKKNGKKTSAMQCVSGRCANIGPGSRSVMCGAGMAYGRWWLCGTEIAYGTRCSVLSPRMEADLWY
eukprot:667017-Rhodomonas_salina.2